MNAGERDNFNVFYFQEKQKVMHLLISFQDGQKALYTSETFYFQEELKSWPLNETTPIFHTQDGKNGALDHM